MREDHLQLLLRHPDVIALMVIAMTLLAHAGPPFCLLRLVGLL